MALTLYGSPRSRAMRTLWVLAELGLAFEHVAYDWVAPQLKSPEFLALNPAGAVPMIVDGGVVVAESLAIALYLARRYGDAGPEPLFPPGHQAEADILRWSLWAQGHLEPWVQRDSRLQSLYATAPAEMHEEALRSLAILERALQSRAWLCADHFIVGDLNVASILSPSRSSQLPIADHPALEGWLGRCYGRPAAVATRAKYA